MKHSTRIYKEWRRPRKVYEPEAVIDACIKADIERMKRATRSLSCKLA